MVAWSMPIERTEDGEYGIRLVECDRCGGSGGWSEPYGLNYEVRWNEGVCGCDDGLIEVEDYPVELEDLATSEAQTPHPYPHHEVLASDVRESVTAAAKVHHDSDSLQWLTEARDKLSKLIDRETERLGTARAA